MKSHLKRLSMPKTWEINRKKSVFVIRPRPGTHNLKLSVPLLVILRDMIKVGKTQKEIKFILNNKEVLINGQKRKDVKVPVGVLDLITIPELKKTYRVVLNKKRKLDVIEVKGNDAEIVPLKIVNKTSIKSGKIQLNFYNGGNLIVEKDVYKTNDVIMFNVNQKKIVDHIKFDKNVMVYLISGNHVSKVGTIQDIKEKNIIIKTKDSEFETLIKYSIIIGKDKPIINLLEE